MRQCLAGNFAQFDRIRSSRMTVILDGEEELVSCRVGTNDEFNVATLER
jgi:hypothetical protein